MLSQKTIDDLKSALLKFGIEIPVKKIEAPIVKLEDVVLKDGSMLMVDKLEVGAKAELMGADGIPVPAEGSFEAEDGSLIVAVAGLITDITPKVAEEAPVEPAAPSEEMTAILNRLDAIEKTYKANTTTLETQLSETKKGLVIALSAIETINTASVAVNLESQKAPKKAVSEMSELELFREFKRNK